MKTIAMMMAGMASLVSIAAVAAPPMERKAPQPVTRSEVQQRVAERFAKWDTNGDGKVTQAEFDAARAARRTEWRDKRFAKLDTDRNGEISKTEFETAQGPDGRGPREGGRRFAHRGGMGGGMMGRGGLMALDTNKDGAVTLAEAQARALARFDQADTNKDGVVTPEERRAAWQAMRGPKPAA